MVVVQHVQVSDGGQGFCQSVFEKGDRILSGRHPSEDEIVSNYIGVFVGCVFVLVSLWPGPIMRGRSGVPHENQKLVRIVMALIGLMIFLLCYSTTPMNDAGVVTARNT